MTAEKLLRTREQKYAADIFERVERIDEEYKHKPAERRKYGAMAHKLPVLVRTAGLAQALAFVDARGDEPHHQLLQDLAVTVGYGDAKALLNASRDVAFYEYMRLSQKVMAALLWYKRFAQSVLGVEPSDEPEDGGMS
jgi:CRISPR-associated protein Cmr5